MLFAGCSPIKGSFHDGGHQWELTVHEVRTHLDDLRHDVNCFRSELQIVEERLRNSENASLGYLQQAAKVDQILGQVQTLEKRWGALDKKNGAGKEEVDRLAKYSGDTSLALTQIKHRLEEIEKEIALQNRRLDVVAKLKGNIETLTQSLQEDSAKVYKVRSGDSLEKIAKMHKIDVTKLKQHNHLESDRILVGQEIKIP